MESILFSLNSVMPLFLMGIAGYLLVQRGVVNENFVDQASNLCFKLLIPFSLFREVYDAKVLDSFDFRLPLYCVLSVLTVLILAWLIWPHFVKDRARCGACIHSTFRANVVLMGIPVLTNMYGEEGALVAAMALPFVVILSNIGAVTVFTAFAPESSGAGSTRASCCSASPRTRLLSLFCWVWQHSSAGFPSRPLPPNPSTIWRICPHRWHCWQWAVSSTPRRLRATCGST